MIVLYIHITKIFYNIMCSIFVSSFLFIFIEFYAIKTQDLYSLQIIHKAALLEDNNSYKFLI